MNLSHSLPDVNGHPQPYQRPHTMPPMKHIRVQYCYFFIIAALICAWLQWSEYEHKMEAARTLLEPIRFKSFRPQKRYAVATLYTSDATDLAAGACKIARQTRRMMDVDLVMLTTQFRKNMAECGWEQIIVPLIECPDPLYESRYATAKLYTKLHIWNLTRYQRVLYVDLDTLPITQYAEIFDTDLRGCDAGMVTDMDRVYASHFNAGVILVEPAEYLFNWLVGNITLIPHDLQFLEQTYLNEYLRGRICPLPHKYNAIIIDRKAWPTHVSIVHFTTIKTSRRLEYWYLGYNDMLAIWDLA